jgi:hypothetical protein
MSFNKKESLSGTIFSKELSIISPDSFILIKVLGRGAFGKVMLV